MNKLARFGLNTMRGALVAGLCFLALVAAAAGKGQSKSLPNDDAAIKYLELIQRSLYVKLREEPSRFDEQFISELFERYKRSGANQMSEEQLAEFKKDLTKKLAVAPRSRYQDLYGYMILQSLDTEINVVLQRSSMKLGVPPLFGTLPTRRVNARTFRPPNSNRVIVAFEDQVFNFANLFAKAVAQGFPSKPGDTKGRVEFSTDIDQVKAHLLSHPEAQTRFEELFVANIMNGRPGAAPQYFLGGPQMSLAEILRAGMEFFVLGHEYGHVIANHLSKSKKLVASLGEAKADELLHSWEDELEADWIGLQLCMAAITSRGYSSSFAYAAAILFVDGMQMVERSLSIIRTGSEEIARTSTPGSHPPWVLRRQFLKKAGARLMGENFGNAEALSDAVSSVLELLWPATKERLLTLRERGASAHISWDE